ncbi:hypothetical protein ACM7Z6_13380 [Pseudomonas aeruginosa]
MKNTLFAVAALTLLAGCDAAKDAMSEIIKEEQPMTLVFPAGYMAQVGGNAVPIFGTDPCPSADKYMKLLFGPEPDEGQRACVVVSPETQTVNVLVGGGERPELETWTVERDGDRTMLRREDGSYVTEAIRSGDGAVHAESVTCVTTGPNSPIVAGENTVVVIDGKSYEPGQSADCAPETNNISTHGANSPIVTGAGAQVIITTE